TGIGLSLAVYRHRFPWLLPLCLVAVPYAAFTFAPFYVPRNLVAALPFASILCAASVGWILRRLHQYRRTHYGIVLAVLMTPGLLMSWRLTEIRSGFAAAARYLRAHHARPLTSTEVMVF